MQNNKILYNYYYISMLCVPVSQARVLYIIRQYIVYSVYAPNNEELRVLLMSDDEVVKTYSSMIFNVAMRYTRNKADADDIYSDVFYRYFKRKRTFDSEEHRKAWLLRVTVNCAKEFLTERKYGEEINDDMFGSETLTGTQEASIEDIMAVREAIKLLDDDMREIIELYYFSGLTVTEIGQMLQRSVNTVKSQLFRGRGRLKELLQ